MKRILLLNSDSPYNKGDQAILLGNIKLLKLLWPDAEITAISNFKERDESWFSIKFIDMPVYTLNPINLIKLSLIAKRSDIVFWGGGELLKDYTNKIAPIYWLIRVALIKLFNPNIYGLFQGIGPTKSKLSKWTIRKTVNFCLIFFLRDSESKQKLIQYGVDEHRLVCGYDPAILNEPNDLNEITNDLNLNISFLKNSVIVGVRKWFHYKKNSWIPLILQRNDSKYTTRHYEIYRKNLTALINLIIEDLDLNVVFFPMFMSENEGDYEFSRSISDEIYKGRSMVLNSNSFSPQQMVDLFSVPKLAISSRLHSSIVAISAGTPALCLYYVDKGRVFYDQLSAEKYALPIEDILDPHNFVKIVRLAKELINDPTPLEELLSKHEKNKINLIKIFKDNLKIK